MKTLVGLIETGLVVVCVLFYLRLAVAGNPVRNAIAVWREMPRRSATRLALVIWFGVFLVDLVETKNDAAISAQFGLDFTGAIASIEGHVASALQALAWTPASVALALAYLILFPALLVGSAHAYDRMNDIPRLRLTLFVYGLNYLLCLPFYLWFPVVEPWSFPGSGVVPLMDLHLHPWLMDLVRPMSGINNCFPSFHTSLTVSLVLVARGCGRVAFERFVAVSGAAIVLSTVYLGFHWILDVASGILAGVVVYALARRFEASAAPATVSAAR